MWQIKQLANKNLINFLIHRCMLNFATLFNQFRSQANSGISQLLEQSAIKMGRLLDEDSFLNEYKSSNPRVIEFMKYERFEELVDFVTVVGPPEDKKRGYKYPLSACDVLSVDNNTAIEYFFPEKPLTVEERVKEEVEVQVQVEVYQSPEAAKEQAKQESPKVEQPVKTQSTETPDVPSEQVPIVVEEKAETAVEVETTPTGQQERPVAATPEKKMRKVLKKEKQIVERVVRRQIEPLITKLMGYFDEEVNYTLAGYVSKILSVFFTKKPAEVMRYVLGENNVERILNHAQSRSVGEFLVKVLTNETTNSLQKRRDCFKSILKRMSTPSQIFILSNISAYVCEIIEKISANLKGNNKILEFNSVFFSLDIIQQVIENVMSDDENVSVYNAPILFTYLTNVPFVLPEEDAIVQDFKALLASFIQKSCEKLRVDAGSRPKLGTGRIKIIEILRFIIKQDVLNSKEIIAKSEGFFKIIIGLMRGYQMNNMLHNEVMKIIDIALAEKEGSAINDAVLGDNLLVGFMVEEAEEDRRIKTGESTYQHRKGFIAHIVNLAMRMKELAEGNRNIKKTVESAEFVEVFETFVEKEVFKNRRSLAGFSLRKDLKHEIMFQKQEIITAYLSFLQKCPGPVFQKAPEQINIEHPDLVQQLEKQLEENLTIKNQAESVQTSGEKGSDQGGESKGHAEQPIVEAEVIPEVGYWSTNLEYNVDELMVDL